MALEPPPETVHDSADAAYEAIRMWAQERGYGIKKRRTKEDKKGSVRRRDIECDRSGVHNVVNPCRPQTVTRRTDCPFKVKLLRQVDGDNGASWRIVVVNPSHNHDASLDPRVHLCHRKRSRQQLDQIKALTTVGQPGRVILTTLLQENPGTMLVPRDIYNEQSRLRREQPSCLTSIESLIETLEKDNDWAFEVKIDPESRRVTHLFFTLSYSVGLMQSFPDVALMDAIYKTNRFKMPLLHFVGVTPIDTSFSAAFCFVPGKCADDYLWALQMFKFAMGNIKPRVIVTDGDHGLKGACREVFPDVPQRLCLWNVNQNVLAKVKTTWKENALGGLTTGQVEAQRQARDTFMDRWDKVSCSSIFRWN
jgi:hypothetical protein